MNKVKEAVDKSWPQNGDDYYWIDDFGAIQLLVWRDDGVNKAHMERGNVFRTREEAEKADRLRLAMNEVKVMSEKAWSLEDGPINWADDSQKKWTAYWSGVTGEWAAEYYTFFRAPFVISFPTQESAMDAYRNVDAKHPGVIR